MDHNLAFGILSHEALFNPRTDPEETRTPPELFKDMYNHGKVKIHKKIDGTGEEAEIDIDFKDNKGQEIDRAHFLNIGQKLADKTDGQLNKMNIKHLEKRMAHMLINPKTGHEVPETDGFFLCGTKDIQRKERITDVKTSAKRLTEDQVRVGDYHFQLNCYRYLTILDEGFDYKNNTILNLVKTNDPQVLEFNHEGNFEDLLMVYQTFIWVAKQIKEYYANNFWPRNPSACLQYGVCQFHALCWPEQYSRPDLVVKEKLYKRFH